MVTNRYSFSLTDLTGISDPTDFSISISVSDKVFNCRFLWAIATQEQYDLMHQELVNNATNDPLMGGTSPVRDYDWVEYYLALQDVDLDEWLDEQTVLPASIINKSRYEQVTIIQQNIAKALEYQETLQIFQETLRWQVTVHEVTSDDTTVAVVQPGGWYNYFTDVSFRFVSGYNYIGKDDLQYVTMEFDINE
jgi:hypothetical protein